MAAGTTTITALVNAGTADEVSAATLLTVTQRAARIGGIHVYTFNELERTENWRRELVAQLTPDNDK